LFSVLCFRFCSTTLKLLNFMRLQALLLAHDLPDAQPAVMRKR
jgi:hypothetical protein